jgi:hypothetical protein
VITILGQISGLLIGRLGYLVLLSDCSMSLISKFIVSSLIGFAYGLLFGCSPVISSPPFSINDSEPLSIGAVWNRVYSLESNFKLSRTFSQNWGWISLTPAFSSTVFNFVYGLSRVFLLIL